MDMSNETVQPQQQDLIMISQAYESLRDNGLNLKGAICEYVDNSIQAKATEVHIFKENGVIGTNENGKPVKGISQFVVCDNGCGMDDDTLKSALRFGHSSWTTHESGRNIGKYGAGVVEAGISQGRRIEVYSRYVLADGGLSNWHMTFIDLDDIHGSGMSQIPQPVEAVPPAQYAKPVGNSSGTIFIVSHCDRPRNADGLATWLGRVFRKQIEDQGVLITYQSDQVFVQDPLYLSTQTQCDYRNAKEGREPEEKAELICSDEYEFPIPGSNGLTDVVTVTITLLPESWRKEGGEGGKAFATEHKIQENEGVSILREGREVFYGPCYGLIKRATQENDRWWGCEINVPATLDHLFVMEHIKNKIQPSEKLLDKISPDVKHTIGSPNSKKPSGLMRRIVESRAKARAQKANESGKYASAEEAMSKAPVKQNKPKVKLEEVDALLDSLVNRLADKADSQEKKEIVRKELREKPYTIKEVSLPSSTLFEATPIGKNLNIGMNVNHAFYKALQGVKNDLERQGVDEATMIKLDNVVALLISSYGKAQLQTVDYFDEVGLEKYSAEEVTEQLENFWGTLLSTFLHNSDMKGGN